MLEDAGESAEEEVARAAGGVDELEIGEAKFSDGRFGGALEDKILNENWGLEKGVFFTRGFGEVLIQIAEETGRSFHCVSI